MCRMCIFFTFLIHFISLTDITPTPPLLLLPLVAAFITLSLSLLSLSLTWIACRSCARATCTLPRECWCQRTPRGSSPSDAHTTLLRKP